MMNRDFDLIKFLGVASVCAMLFVFIFLVEWNINIDWQAIENSLTSNLELKNWHYFLLLFAVLTRK